MFIQTEATPNPATLKFIPGRTVLGDGSVDYRDKQEAGGSPLALRLFTDRYGPVMRALDRALGLVLAGGSSLYDVALVEVADRPREHARGGHGAVAALTVAGFVAAAAGSALAPHLAIAALLQVAAGLIPGHAVRHADLSGLPPIYTQVGGAEALLGESERLTKLAADAGVDARLDVFPGRLHTFQMAAGYSAEADEAIGRFAQWTRPKLGL